MPARLVNTLKALWRRDDWERDLDDELRLHVEQRAEHLVRTGMAPQEARRRARLELGSRETYREQCRRSAGLRWFDELRQDLRYTLRTLRKSPGFLAVAVLSLALGIGANTVVFSIVNTMLLRGLPVRSPGRIFFVQGPGHSFPNYRDLRDRNTTFSGMIGYRVAQLGIETRDGPRRLWGYLATGNYFDVLGVQPVVGRFFHAEDDLKPGASPYAVLSYAAWQSRFAGDAAIAGKTVRINALPYTILGVAPAGFYGTELVYWPDVWIPMMMQPIIEGRSWLDNRYTFNTWVAGRLRDGVTPQQATANLNSIAQTLSHDFPAENAGLKFGLARPGLVGDMLRGTVQAFLAGIMMLAGLVLLAACANLASLLAARTMDRHFEIAIRLSIGAGRGRILRQLLTEALSIAMLGGAAGLGLAYGVLNLIGHAPPPIDFPVRFDCPPDLRVLLFAFAASLVTGLIFGVAPARRAVSTDPNGALRGSTAGRNSHRRWAPRDFLLAAQVALCCFLVTACFVSVRGLSHAFETPVGLAARGLNVAAFDMELAHYSREEGARFQRRALDAVWQLPGVTAAAYGNSVPLWVDQSRSEVFSEQDTGRRNRGMAAIHYDASPGYLAAMGTRLVAGRDFTWHDDRKAPLVGIVNQTFARVILKTPDAVGRRYRIGTGGPLMEVIGIVEDGKYESLTEMPRPVFFRSVAQNYNNTTVLLMRSSLPEAEAAAQLRKVMATLDPRLPVYALGSINQLLGLAYFPARTATAALTAFGLLAVMLAVTGIYGLAAYTVSRRVREIGVRVAVGAQPWQVLRSVMGRIGTLLLVGCCAGLAMGLASTRLLASIVYQATPRDPMVLGAVAATMALVALAAAWVPARRAVSVDPIRSLRHE
ncbi:MAG TPA: ABC transporter permease [Candidatus Acidoferrales bacterium]|jgi:predicted permease|nr:ABC transporter permease [Candidatus Acidoferrales bacterium]